MTNLLNSFLVDGNFLLNAERPEQHISATVVPAIQKIEEGETISLSLLASATDPANYTSDVGSIITVRPDWSINNGFWITAGNVTIVNGDTVMARVTIVDDKHNSKVFVTDKILITDWLLRNGVWEDERRWEDTLNWKDAA